MLSVTVFEVIDDSDGEVLRATLSKDMAESWLASEKERGSDVPMVIRATVRKDVGDKVAALAYHLGADPGSIETCRHSDDCFECESEPGEYRVLTESEREAAADDALESYIDECIIEQAKAEARDNAALNSLIKVLSDHFDRASWKRDALINDGYGHTLSGYDGNEHEQKIGETWFYIYRVN